MQIFNNLEIQNFYRETETNILHEADDIQFLLNRHIVDTRILKGSRFVVPHRGKYK